METAYRYYEGKSRLAQRQALMKHFHNAYPSAGMSTGRVFCGVAERSEGKKGVSACRYRYGKNNRSNFLKALVLSMKTSCSFFLKIFVLFGKEQDLLRVSNVSPHTLLMCGV